MCDTDGSRQRITCSWWPDLTSTPGPKRSVPYTVELVAGCYATLPNSNPGSLSCTIAGCGGEAINGVGNYAPSTVQHPIGE